MRSVAYILFALMILLAGVNNFAAQQPKPLDRERLAQDIANASFLARVPEIGVDSLASIRAALGPPDSITENGFGLTIFHFPGNEPRGYTKIGLTVFALGDKILRYRVAISAPSDHWWPIHIQLMDAWKKNTRLEAKETDSSLYFEREFSEVLTAYRAFQIAEFGEFKDLPVPAELIERYRLLSSPSKEVVVGDACGYGGGPPEGKKGIDVLVQAGRLDLVENLLSGPNLGGRVYAALALLQLEREGTTLSEIIRTRISKLRNSNVMIMTCGGCLSMHQSIRDIFADMEKFERVREELQRSSNARAKP